MNGVHSGSGVEDSGARSGARAVQSGCWGLGGHRETASPGWWALVVVASDGVIVRTFVSVLFALQWPWPLLPRSDTLLPMLLPWSACLSPLSPYQQTQPCLGCTPGNVL